jgi:hypothetical protein
MTGLLIFIGVVLVILNVMAIKKQDKSFDGVLGNAIGNINDYDIKLGEIRREFSESIIELQSELMIIREAMEKNVNIAEDAEKISDDDKSKIVIDDLYNNDDTSTSTSISSNNGNADKVQEIKRLLSEGLSITEISEILQLGKGEVLLIKDLYIR